MFDKEAQLIYETWRGGRTGAPAHSADIQQSRGREQRHQARQQGHYLTGDKGIVQKAQMGHGAVPDDTIEYLNAWNEFVEWDEANYPDELEDYRRPPGPWNVDVYVGEDSRADWGRLTQELRAIMDER